MSGLTTESEADKWLGILAKDGQMENTFLWDRRKNRITMNGKVINPLFPALRSVPMAPSGPFRRKQIGGLSGSRLFVPLHEQIDRGGTGGTGGPW
jgi:hypothetical protein